MTARKTKPRTLVEPVTKTVLRHGVSSKRRSAPLSPSTTLLTKVSTIITHVEAFCDARDATGHFARWQFEQFKQLVREEEVQAWLADMRKLALLRSAR